MADQEVGLDHVYLLGWYGADGEAYYSTWDGADPIYDFVVTGPVEEILGKPQPPLWNAAVLPGVEVHRVPEGVKPQDHARALGGVYAFGWITQKPITRREPSEKALNELAERLWGSDQEAYWRLYHAHESVRAHVASLNSVHPTSPVGHSD